MNAPGLDNSKRSYLTENQPLIAREDGMAALIALCALSIFSLVSFYMAFGAKTELRISDNHESEVQAVYAAKAGLNHARELIRGLTYNDLLRGPDGMYSADPTYLAQARSFNFRNPLSWAAARSLNIYSPMSTSSTISDDGVLSTGLYHSTNGTPLIPQAGIAFNAPNAYGAGTVTTARYFVRVSDNNGEASELLGDPANDPFVDGDHVIIIRSMGVAQTILETAGGVTRRNSVAVVEARFRQSQTLALDAPFVIEGNDILPSRNSIFDGNSFGIEGQAANYGIATIDTAEGDGILPSQVINSSLSPNQRNNIQGLGGSPSISDISGSILPGTDKALLKDPAYISHFIGTVVPTFADSIFQGDQHWAAGDAPDLGSYDYNKPHNDPSQRPKVTYVNGDLDIGGNLTGGGLLVVRGRLNGNGRFDFNGLILVIGEGDVDLAGWNLGLEGGMFVANLTETDGQIAFGTPKITIGGNSNIRINSQNLSMGLGLIPAIQLSLRDVNSMMDP